MIMQNKVSVILLLVSVFAAISCGSVIKTDIVTISTEKQHNIVGPNSNSALAVHFEAAKDWHLFRQSYSPAYYPPNSLA